MTVKPFEVGNMPPPRCWSSQPCSSEECVDNRLKATVEERDALRAQLATEREAHEKALAESEARYVAQTDALLKVEREAHARTLAALRAVVGHFVGVDHHRDDCPGLLDHDGLTVLGPVCRDHQVAEQAEAALAAAKVTP